MTSLWVGFYLPPTFEGKREFDWPELEDLNCELPGTGTFNDLADGTRNKCRQALLYQ